MRAIGVKGFIRSLMTNSAKNKLKNPNKTPLNLDRNFLFWFAAGGFTDAEGSFLRGVYKRKDRKKWF